MYRINNRRAIINRRGLLAELESLARSSVGQPEKRSQALSIFKSGLNRGSAEIRRRFEEKCIGGCETIHAHAFLVDQLVRCIYDFALLQLHPAGKSVSSDTMSVAATGGYGRAELAPYSDIDLMFLLPKNAATVDESVVEYVLYMLWDTGLKVGHATRSIEDCIRLSNTDLTIRTSLLEARWLWGERKLFEAFEESFIVNVLTGTGTSFVEKKLSERDVRHERMGDSRYVLEPNIKEGKGGLRDLQTLFWIAKYLYRVKEMGELLSLGVFTAADVQHFRKAQSFLWTVRCHLHYVAGRPEERLTFNYQDIIGRRLGYTDRPGVRGVERFMKHYFRVTKAVGDLTRVLCAVLEEDHNKPRYRFRLSALSLFRRAPVGFRLDGDRLTVDAPDAFQQDPIKMLRLFHEAQRYGLDVHPRALRLVQQNLRLVDAALRNTPEANDLFMSMLTSAHDPESTLRRLNDAGLFGRFIPDFGRVVAQMQYDMYHVYTVDEHTIRAIGILSRIEQSILKDQHPTATIAFGEIRSRRALYLAVLLHDIAKGRGGDHSILGADIAVQLAPRLGLDDWETETVAWLVRHHLLMSRTAFKRDTDDPKTVLDFTSVVQSPERLRMLLILTNADIHAVGPGIWNAWKEGLLSELYYRSLEEMEMTGGQPTQRREVRVERAKAKVRSRLHSLEEATVDAFISRGYSDYWLAFDVEEHVRHFEMIGRAETLGRSLIVEARQHPSRDVTEITIYAPDHAGLFARIAGAIALSGGSIVDAKVITLANSMALDVLHIQDLSGRSFDSADRIARLTRRIEETIVGRIEPGRELKAVRLRALPTRTRVFTVPPRVIFDNRASASHTVIEVNGRDRPGFLLDVTSTLTAQGLQIVSAHISTYGERVVDVFYVKDVFGLKVEQAAKLERIERELLRAIGPQEEPWEASQQAQEAAAAE